MVELEKFPLCDFSICRINTRPSFAPVTIKLRQQTQHVRYNAQKFLVRTTLVTLESCCKASDICCFCRCFLVFGFRLNWVGNKVVPLISFKTSVDVWKGQSSVFRNSGPLSQWRSEGACAESPRVAASAAFSDV